MMATMLREYALVDCPVSFVAELHGLKTYLERVDGLGFSIDGSSLGYSVLGLTITVTLRDGTKVNVVKRGTHLEIQTLDPRHSEYLTRLFRGLLTFLHDRV